MVDASVKFTSQEIELFERQHENGYDLTIGSRYMLWLNSVHPEEADPQTSFKESTKHSGEDGE